MKYFKLLLAALLLILAANIQATDLHPTDVGGYLEHNQNLLTKSTIGENLRKSTDAQVVELYDEATFYLEVAKYYFKAGEFDNAKESSLLSIHTLYSADRAFYGLSE